MGDESTRTREERQREKVRGKVARAAARIAPLFGALTVSLIAGCTAILELDREQCEVSADCTDLFGASSTYVCVDKVCELPPCDTDAQCREIPGPGFATAICSEAHQCVPGQCTDNSQCSPGICNLATNRCVDRECQTTQECIFKGGETKTVSCTNGFCVDDMWGCIGKDDDRPVMASTMGTLKIPLLSSTDNTPLGLYDDPATPDVVEKIPPRWVVEVCPPPSVDPNCTNKIVSADKVIYDEATGIATVPGIPNVPFRVKIDEINYPPYVPKDPGEQAGPAIVPMDFYTQKPVIGETTIPPLKVVSRVGLNALIKAFAGISNPNNPGGEPVVNNAKGNIYGLVFDCQSNPAAEVALDYFDALNIKLSPNVLYFENATPVLTAKWSFPTGIFSTLNLPTTPITVQTSLVLDSAPNKDNPNIRDITKARVIRSGYSLLLQPLRMTTVHFHPRKY